MVADDDTLVLLPAVLRPEPEATRGADPDATRDVAVRTDVEDPFLLREVNRVDTRDAVDTAFESICSSSDLTRLELGKLSKCSTRTEYLTVNICMNNWRDKNVLDTSSLSSPLVDRDSGDFGGENACLVALTFLIGGEVDAVVRDVAVVARELVVTLELGVDALVVVEIVRARSGCGDMTAALDDARILEGDCLDGSVVARAGEAAGGLVLPFERGDVEAVFLITGLDADDGSRRGNGFFSASESVPLLSVAAPLGRADLSPADLSLLCLNFSVQLH